MNDDGDVFVSNGAVHVLEPGEVYVLSTPEQLGSWTPRDREKEAEALLDAAAAAVRGTPRPDPPLREDPNYDVVLEDGTVARTLMSTVPLCWCCSGDPDAPPKPARGHIMPPSMQVITIGNPRGVKR